MKRTIATTLIALAALTGAASAMTTDAVDNNLSVVAPNVDASNLTDAELAQVRGILLGGDSDAVKRSLIKSVIN